jgi:hypothetical protein
MVFNYNRYNCMYDMPKNKPHARRFHASADYERIFLEILWHIADEMIKAIQPEHKFIHIMP